MANHDAVLILGGGVREGGVLPPYSQARFDLALQLHDGRPLVCLSAGTMHRPPPLDAQGFPYFEAYAGAAYLLQKGVPAAQIRVEAVSYDTIGNAYFSKLLHVDPEGWQRLLVITSEFHMPRSKAIFEWVYGLGPRTFSIEYAASPDTGLDEEAVASRRQKEAASLAGLAALRQRLRTAHDLHRWIFTEHGAYAARTQFTREQVDRLHLKDSY